MQLQKSTSKPINSNNNNLLEKSASFNTSQQKLSENSSLKVVTTESKILGRYGDFIASLESDDNLKPKVLREAMGFIKSIQALPFKSGFLLVEMFYFEYIYIFLNLQLIKYFFKNIIR